MAAASPIREGGERVSDLSGPNKGLEDLYCARIYVKKSSNSLCINKRSRYLLIRSDSVDNDFFP